jgi:hypothetical protein
VASEEKGGVRNNEGDSRYSGKVSDFAQPPRTSDETYRMLFILECKPKISKIERYCYNGFELNIRAKLWYVEGLPMVQVGIIMTQQCIL